MILIGVSLNQTPLDWEGNTRRILESLYFLKTTDAGREKEPKIILFPELSLSGYGCEDGFFFSHTGKLSLEMLNRILQASRHFPRTLILIGLPFWQDEKLYNAMAVIYENALLGIIPKTHLAGEGLHYEPRWFSSYRKKTKQITVKLKEKEYPVFFGQTLLRFFGANIVVEICEDSWVNFRPSLFHYKNPIDIILNPSASHFGFGKHTKRKNIALASSQYFHSYYFSVNLLGNEAGKVIYDGSIILAKNGKLYYESERFSFSDIVIRAFSLDFTDLIPARKRLYAKRYDYYRMKTFPELTITSGSRSLSGTFAESTPEVSFESIIDFSFVKEVPPPVEEDKNTIFKEFLDAEVLGLFDYMRKTKSHGYTVSLSGGADSSVCAILVYQMIRKGILSLGPEAFLKKTNLPLTEEEIKHLQEIPAESQIAFFSSKILHTIYQKTNQNSPQTQELAGRLAEELSCDHKFLEIQKHIDILLDDLETLLQMKFSWKEHDLILQNIQSRFRSPVAWFIANVTNSILITTANRNEGSVGYATMDGDTSGGLAPLSGVDKPFILQFLHFISEYEDRYYKPVKTAKEIAAQIPSAELRPLEEKQTDEKDLMPYPILSFIERFAIEELLSPEEIKERVTGIKNNTFPYHSNLPYYRDFLEMLSQTTEEEIVRYINMFYEKWHKSQWKRERMAPGFHMDSYHIDPRGWFRFPVISKENKLN